MIVKELIELLQRYDPNLHVMVDGYEGGLDDIFNTSLSLWSVGLNVNPEEYYGKHEPVGSYAFSHRHSSDTKIVDALVISRERWK